MQCWEVVKRRYLIRAIWGCDIEGNNLDVFVRLLRNKIDNDARTRLIHTVRGVGYVVRSEPAEKWAS